MEDRRVDESRNAEDIAIIYSRLSTLESQLKLAISNLADMIEINNSIRKNSSEMVNLMGTVHTGLKVIGSLAKIAKWITVVGGAVAMLWAAYSTIRNGTPPVIHIGQNGHDY